MANLSEAMQAWKSENVGALSKGSDDIVKNLRENYKGKFGTSPWNRIPDCSKLTIELGYPSPIFSHYGIKKRIDTKISVEKYRNNQINRYMEHQIMRLDRNIANPKLYWRIAELCMKRSNCFRVCAINHVFPQWHRRQSLNFILAVNRKVSKIINKGIWDLDYRRVYIPKGEKGYRPLGVPTPEWRIYLHMWANFLNHFLKPRLDENQHGFLTGKGTLTCWKAILSKKVMEHKYVKEWDFKSFFNTLNLTKLEFEMQKHQIPFKICDYFRYLNESQIKWCQFIQEEESYELARIPQYGIYRSMDLWEEHILNPEADDALSLSDFSSEYFEDAILQTYNMRGVPQGSPTSPIMGNIIMNLWLKSDRWNKIAYADDSIGWSNTKCDDVPPVNSGIEINPEKSGWIKYNNRHIKPLKFLGLCWDGKNMWADTRKGSKLKLTNEIKNLLNLIDKTREKLYMTYEEALDYLSNKESINISGTSVDVVHWEKWFKMKIAGWIQSRLYLGEWANPDINQCFKFVYQRGSWCDTKLAKLCIKVRTQKVREWVRYKNPDKIPKEVMDLYNNQLDIFNSSSYACHSLLNLLRYNSKCRKDRLAHTKVIWEYK